MKIYICPGCGEEVKDSMLKGIKSSPNRKKCPNCGASFSLEEWNDHVVRDTDKEKKAINDENQQARRKFHPVDDSQNTKGDDGRYLPKQDNNAGAGNRASASSNASAGAAADTKGNSQSASQNEVVKPAPRQEKPLRLNPWNEANKAALEEQKRKAEADEARRKAEAARIAAEKKKAAEAKAEAERLAAERRKQAELAAAEKKKKAEEERQRREAEEKKKAEEELRRKAAEEKARADEKARQEAAKKAAAEAERKKKEAENRQSIQSFFNSLGQKPADSGTADNDSGATDTGSDDAGAPETENSGLLSEEAPASEFDDIPDELSDDMMDEPPEGFIDDDEFMDDSFEQDMPEDETSEPGQTGQSEPESGSSDESSDGSVDEPASDPDQTDEYSGEDTDEASEKPYEEPRAEDEQADTDLQTEQYGSGEPDNYYEGSSEADGSTSYDEPEPEKSAAEKLREALKSNRKIHEHFETGDDSISTNGDGYYDDIRPEDSEKKDKYILEIALKAGLFILILAAIANFLIFYF